MTRPRVVAGERRSVELRGGLAVGAVSALVGGAVFSVAIWFADWFGVDRIREVFVAVTEPLIDFLTFDKGVPAGLPILIGLCVVGGVVGGFARTAPVAIRRPVTAGVLAVILFGLLQRIVPIVFVELGFEADWLYRRGSGLTFLGGLIVFVIAAGANAAWNRDGGRSRERIRKSMEQAPAARLGLLVAIMAILAILPLLLGTVISEVLGQVMIYVLLGLGLNIVVGYAGLLDLGYVAFFAFGAYTTGVLTGAFLNTTTGAATPALSADLNFFVAVWIVALLAAGVGLLIGAPVLRLRGDYLAIVTLGLGEIVSVITASKWAQPLIGGPQGMRGVTKAEFFGLNLAGQPPALLLPGARVRLARGVRLVAIVEVADRTGVERDAGGRTGRRCDGDQHDEVQAAGVRARRRDRIARRRAVRGQHRVAHAGELRDHRVDHGPRRRDHRWAREHPRRGGRSPGAARAAGAPA